MILQSASFRHSCHHQLRLAFDYTPMHQDDQGEFSSRSKIALGEREEAVVAIAVNIARGHDASYPFKATGAAEDPVITGQCGAGYYLSAVEKGGEPAGTRQFGFEWAYPPASKGGVITGFPEKAIARFYPGRAQITKTTLALAGQYEKDRGHAPDQRGAGQHALVRQRDDAPHKRDRALDFTALLRGRDRASRVAELATLRDLARTIWHSAPRASAPNGARGDTRAELAQTATRLAPHGGVAQGQERAAVATRLAQGQESRVAWNRPDPVHCIYRAHGGERYATRAQLSMQEQLLADAQSEGAPYLARDRFAALLSADLGQLQTQLHAGAAGG
jgi:hypothetical protein